jgi:phosphatidylinositol-3-phosphatase
LVPRRLLLVLPFLAALAVAATPAQARPPIRHVWVIVLENKGYDTTFGGQSPAPYLSRTLPGRGALLTQYYGVTHVSLGNYLAMVSGQGSNPQTQTDCQVFSPFLPGRIGADGQALGSGCVYPRAVRTVADQLDAAHRSWRAYEEDMRRPCLHPALGAPDPTQKARVGDQYAARHNPFVYFRSLLDSGACAAHDLPYSHLAPDLRRISRTPSFSFITPNLCHDGHDAPCVDGAPGGLVSADAFLRGVVPRIMRSPAYRHGLLVITFDEAEPGDASACCGEPQFPNTQNNGFTAPGRGGGRTGAVLLSPYINPGTVDHTPYNHFSLLRSVEDAFHLRHLGYAARRGLRPFGADVFTCYDPRAPRRRGHRYLRGQLIALATLRQGTARRPTLAVRLRHSGRVRITVARGAHRRQHPYGRRATGAPCQPLRFGLPFRHGALTVIATRGPASERRSIRW